jgi:hypothetical protein
MTRDLNYPRRDQRVGRDWLAILSLNLAVLAWPLAFVPRVIERLAWRNEILQAFAIMGPASVAALVLAIVAYRRHTAVPATKRPWMALVSMVLSGIGCAVSLLGLVTNPR